MTCIMFIYRRYFSLKMSREVYIYTVNDAVGNGKRYGTDTMEKMK